MPTEVVELTGTEIEVELGCSEEWAREFCATFDAAIADDATTVTMDVLLRDTTEKVALSDFRESVERQLDGVSGVRVLPDQPLVYTIGFSGDHGERLLDHFDTATDAGTDSHTIRCKLSMEQAETLATTLREQDSEL